MTKLILSAVGILLTPITSISLAAQGTPGTNLVVVVQIDSVGMKGDTVSVGYTLTNQQISLERLVFFTVDASVAPVSISVPDPGVAWSVSDLYRGRSVVRWASLDPIAPSASTPALTFQALGLPGIVSAWYRGDSLPSLGTSDTAESDTPQPDLDPLAAYSVGLFTVGADPFPPNATLTMLQDRLDALIARSCVLSWIADPTLCVVLRTLAGGNVTGFLAQVQLRHGPGQPINDAAYWLLKVNAEYILSMAQ